MQTSYIDPLQANFIQLPFAFAGKPHTLTLCRQTSVIHLPFAGKPHTFTHCTCRQTSYIDPLQANLIHSFFAGKPHTLTCCRQTSYIYSLQANLIHWPFAGKPYALTLCRQTSYIYPFAGKPHTLTLYRQTSYIYPFAGKPLTLTCCRQTSYINPLQANLSTPFTVSVIKALPYETPTPLSPTPTPPAHVWWRRVEEQSVFISINIASLHFVLWFFHWESGFSWTSFSWSRN